MNVLRIILEVLIAVTIWAVVELALTIRKARSSVDDISKQVGDIAESANATIEQVQPMLTKVDGMIDDLDPAIKQVPPLIEKANTAIDVVTVDLASVNDILVDVSEVTDTASNVTSTVSKAANSAVSGVAGVVGKFTSGGKGKERRRKLTQKSSAGKEAPKQEQDAAPVEAPAADDAKAAEGPKAHSYFTYGSKGQSNEDAE